MQKRIFCLFLCLVLVLSVLPLPVRAGVHGSEQQKEINNTTSQPDTKPPEVQARPIFPEETEPAETEPEDTEPPETEPVEVPEYREEGGDYYFTNFAGLKALCDGHYEYGTYFYYEGPDPLVIREDLTMPADVQMDFWNQTVIVPPGVTFSAPADAFTSLDVGTFRVEGTVELGRYNVIWVYKALIVEGTLKTGSSVNLWNGVVLEGQENIRLQGQGQLNRTELPETLAEFYASVDKAARDHTGMSYGIVWDSDEEHTLTESLTVPENVELSIDVARLTVPQGVTLELNCGVECNIYADMTVAGQLINNTEEIDYYGKLTFTETGSYTATGSLDIWAETPEETLEEHLEGLDLSDFTVQREADPTFDIYLWYITPGGGGPEQDPQKLSTPTDVAFDSKGQLSWSLTDTRQGTLVIQYYQEGLQEPVATVRKWMQTGQGGTDYELSWPELSSGTYYATLQFQPDTQSGGTLQASDTVTSESFVYRRPASRYAAPGGLTWDTWPNFHWSRPAGHTQGFEIEFYYAETATETPELITYQRRTDTTLSVPQWVIDRQGDGCYYFRVKAASGDITQTATSPWSDLSPAYTYGQVIQENNLAAGSTGEVTWTLTESGRLVISGSGYMGDYWREDPDWYAYREQITGVMLEPGVTNVGARAFYDLPNLTSVSIPEGVTEIQDFAFALCPGLTKVSLPASLEVLGYNPFAGDHGLTSLTVEPGNSGIYTVDNVLFQTWEDETWLISYPCADTAQTYTVPQGVTYIFGAAFASAENLWDVILPRSLTSIGEYAFMNSQLRSITIPETVTWIGGQAFADCPELVSVRFLGDPPTIETDGFGNVVADAYYPDGNDNWTIWELQGYGGLLLWLTDDAGASDTASGTTGHLTWRITGEGTLILSGEGSTGSYSQDQKAPWYAYRDQITGIQVEEGVIWLSDFAFEALTKATWLQLPESLQDIGNYVFLNCAGLTSVHIPSQVFSTGYNPFAYCSNLKEITVEAGSQHYYTVDGVLFHKNEEDGEYTLCSYPNAKPGTEYTVPEGTTGIFGAAFLGSGLTRVELPEGLEEIYDSAFARTGITHIRFPGSLLYIGREAFLECASLREIGFSGDTAPQIENMAFWNVTAEVTYPAQGNWDTVADRDYGGSLTWVTEDTVIAQGTAGDLLWEITGDGCLNLTGAGGTGDFLDSDAPWYAYRDSVTAIHVGEGVTSIGVYAFYDMSRVTRVTLPEGLHEVLAYAFQNCDSLETVTIPASMTNIGNNPFAGADNLKKIIVSQGNPVFYTVEDVLFYYNPQQGSAYLCVYPGAKQGTSYRIPEGTSVIFDGAFQNNTHLKQVTLPESLYNLGGSAFANSSLTEITVPENVEILEYGVFRSAASLKTVTFEGVPDTVDDTAFQDVTADVWYHDALWPADKRQNYGGSLTWKPLQSSTVAEGTSGQVSWQLLSDGTLVLSGQGETEDCWDHYPQFYQYRDQITGIRLEEGITYVGAYLFDGLYRAAKLELPQSLSYIATAAFIDCDALTNVTIPATVTGMEANPFAGIEALTAIRVASGNPYFRSVDGVLFCDDILVAYPGGKAGESYTVPAGIREIGVAAFFGNLTLKEVNLPEGLLAIDGNAFENAAIPAITIPASVEAVYGYAFGRCSELKEVTFLGNAPGFGANAFQETTATCYYPADNAGWTDDVLQNYGGTLTWQSAGTQESLIATGYVGELNWKLSADGILTVYGNGVTGDFVDYYPTFYQYVEQITAIRVEEGVTQVGDFTFFEMPYVQTVTLPDSLQYLGFAAFMNCEKLTEVHIGAGLKEMGLNPFANLPSLTTVTVAPGNLYYSVIDGVLFRDNGQTLVAYPGGKAGESYVLPQQTRYIFDGAFLGCTGLNRVTLPEGLLNIGSYAFYLSGLESITVPASVSGIELYAFSACDSLETVTFLGGAPTIGEDAFRDVTAEVSYPALDSWTQEKRQNYGGQLTWVPVLQDLASGVTGEVSWRITGDGTMIFYGQGATGDYADTDAPWTGYESRITGIRVEEGVTALGDYCCYRMENAAWVELPETLTFLGENAFYGCAGLSSITLPASLTDFGGYMFANCSNLKEILVAEGNPCFYSRDGVVFGKDVDEGLQVNALCFYPEGKTDRSYTVPSDVNFILEGAFILNKHLRNVTLPQSLLFIGDHAFESSALESVQLPEGLIRISVSAFVGCGNLTEVTIPATVAVIDSYAFADTGLKTIRFLGDAPAMGTGVFENVTADVYYPRDNGTWTAAVRGSCGGNLNWITGGGIDIYGEDTLLGGKSIKLTGFLKPYGGDIRWSVKDGQEELVTLKASGNSVTVTAADVTESHVITLIASAEDGSATTEYEITLQPKVKGLKIYEVWYDQAGEKQYQDMSQGLWWYISLTDQNRYGFTRQLEAECLPLGSEGEITWSSSNSKVATVDPNGKVYFTGKPGSTVFTATAEGGVKASFTQKIIDPIVNAEAVGETTLSLMGGQSVTLKVRNADTGKNITGKNIQWTLWMEDGDPSAFASINSSGKLTTKKVVETATFQVYGDVLTDGVYTDYVCYDVTVYPATTHVELIHEDAVVNGTTLSFNTNIRDNTLVISANVLPEDAMPVELVWTHTDVKGAYADIGVLPDGSLMIFNATGKAGTVTVTGRAQDGSKKTGTVKVQFGAYAESVDIRLQNTVLFGGQSMQLSAQVYPGNVTKSGVTWSLADPGDKAYVTLSGSKLTAKNVFAEQTVTLIATSKDGKASASCEITVLPRDLGMLTIYDSGTDTNVTKSTVTVDLNKEDRTVYLRAVNFYDGSQADVEWKYKSSANASIYESDGMLVVTMLKAGTVNITAKDGSRSAAVTVKASKLTGSLSVTTKTGSNLTQDNTGKTLVQVASGKSVDLKAQLYGGSSNRVTWSIVSGSRYGKLSASGKFTAAKNVSSVQQVVVRATAADGSGVYGEMTVLVKPLATGIKIYTKEADAQMQTLSLYSSGGTTTRSNTNLVWDMESDGGFRIYANVYPYYANAQWRSAMQDITWKSSSAKVASIDKNGNVTCLKPGTTTITATAADGSGQKISFKLTVVKRMTGMQFPETGVVGGKSITLKPIFQPSDVTNKKLYWEISGDTTFAKIDQKGKLTTKKVTQVKTVTVTAWATDGSGVAAQVDVKIWPKAAKSVKLLSGGYDITGDTLTLRQGQSLEVEALVDPGSACQDVTWKVSEEGYVTVADGVITAVRSGKTITVTATANDGSGKKATLKIKTVR